MTHAQVESLQRALNHFTSSYLKYVTPLRVDGDYGQASKHRVRVVKYYLGYPVGRRNSHVGAELLWRLKYPKRPHWKWATPVRLAYAAKRRVYQRHHAKKSQAAVSVNGISTFDGKTVAAWFIPHLIWARDHGWHGTLVSGYRTPAYSQHLCYAICGRPSCPGRCAGTSSNHTRYGNGRGAIDVSDYLTFARVVRESPHRPRIFNDLPRDLVHFSANGH